MGNFIRLQLIWEDLQSGWFFRVKFFSVSSGKQCLPNVIDLCHHDNISGPFLSLWHLFLGLHLWTGQPVLFYFYTLEAAVLKFVVIYFNIYMQSYINGNKMSPNNHICWLSVIFRIYLCQVNSYFFFFIILFHSFLSRPPIFFFFVL